MVIPEKFRTLAHNIFELNNQLNLELAENLNLLHEWIAELVKMENAETDPTNKKIIQTERSMLKCLVCYICDMEKLAELKRSARKPIEA